MLDPVAATVVAGSCGGWLPPRGMPAAEKAENCSAIEFILLLGVPPVELCCYIIIFIILLNISNIYCGS